MSFIERLLKQTATYWGNPVPDGYGGVTFDAPVEVNARWEEKQELFIDTAGQEVRSNAIVYIDQDVDIGGYLYLGSSEEDTPEEQDGTFEIRKFDKIPDLKGVIYLRKVWL